MGMTDSLAGHGRLIEILGLDTSVKPQFQILAKEFFVRAEIGIE
jgi:hypothetical protein